MNRISPTMRVSPTPAMHRISPSMRRVTLTRRAPSPTSPSPSSPPYRLHHKALTPDHHPIAVYYAPQQLDESSHQALNHVLEQRRYTVLHDDYTGNRILYVSSQFEPKRGPYASMMRDEIFGVWHKNKEDGRSDPELHVHAIVTGGPVARGPRYESVFEALGIRRNALQTVSIASDLLAAMGFKQQQASGRGGKKASNSSATQQQQQQQLPCPFLDPYGFWAAWGEAMKQAAAMQKQQWGKRRKWKLAWNVILSEVEDALGVLRWRIFEDHMAEALFGMVLGDLVLVARHPNLLRARVYVHYHGRSTAAAGRMVDYGTIADICHASLHKHGGGGVKQMDKEANVVELLCSVPRAGMDDASSRLPCAIDEHGACGAEAAVFDSKVASQQAILSQQELDKVWSDAFASMGGLLERIRLAMMHWAELAEGRVSVDEAPRMRQSPSLMYWMLMPEWVVPFVLTAMRVLTQSHALLD